MIRAAKSEDQHIVVLMIHTAIEDLVNVFTGSWEMKQALATMAELYNTEETRFSKEHCTIAQRDGVVVGSIIAYPAKEMYRLNAGVVRVMKDKFTGTADELDLLQRQIMASKEAFDDEYYIDSLAVLPVYRGKGVGKELIKEVTSQAKAAGYDKVSLLADITNESAYNVYLKLGFVQDCEMDVLGHSYRHMTKII